MPEHRLKVFITGASSGLGAALARYYGAQGARLGLVGRNAVALAAVAQDLDASCYIADVRDAATMQAAAAGFLAAVGCPDIVIAAAGISVGTLTEEAADAAVFRAVMDANVLGLVHTFAPFIAPMQIAKQPVGGVLCGISSVAGVRGLPGGSAYSASKAAATVYLEALRLEQKRHGIAVVTVAPGYIDTPMTRINPYPMPFKMSAATAAAKVAHCIARRRPHSVIPWQMAAVAPVLKWLPVRVYDALFEKAPRKPRGLPT
ncbi:MAG TPA: SDR family oxidoreductase [Thiobacillus sp.]|nr:MAG: short-chain dehydrogenase [Hydrogenophilales bacterium 28-61-11]OYZ57094.1 MAG: short-chain dehydrogenase [Hydrogenophilales bacterium 16-61-112]OZA45605.1 MAG: short-chain dehydrogenase [Hydrogenophilales bacterium 17-61-76]HQT30332.1 SDR family oxidoreductase [Thiobacillus sp.]HQT69056.1 SDR family oxidoreductase [Thiobacillus sp.]